MPDGPKATQVLLDSKSVRTDGLRSGRKRVGVLLNETFRYKDQLFIRYTIRNESEQPYAPGPPQVVAVDPQHYRSSLYALSNSQLSDKDTARWKTNGQFPVEVVKSEIRATRVEPGHETVGIVGVRVPEAHGVPLVLRLVFPPAPAGPLSVTLVL